MPKKKGTSRGKILIGIILILVVGIAVLGWHDGLFGVTPIENINNFSVDNGTAVTVKGEITLIFGDLVTIQDDTGSLGFTWADSGSLTMGASVPS